MGKSKTIPFPIDDSLTCFKLVHDDVCDIATVVSHSHFKHFVAFIDDYSRVTWICFLRSKSEVFSVEINSYTVD